LVWLMRGAHKLRASYFPLSPTNTNPAQ